jgi:hypothetical protein
MVCSRDKKISFVVVIKPTLSGEQMVKKEFLNR